MYVIKEETHNQTGGSTSRLPTRREAAVAAFRSSPLVVCWFIVTGLAARLGGGGSGGSAPVHDRAGSAAEWPAGGGGVGVGASHWSQIDLWQFVGRVSTRERVLFRSVLFRSVPFCSVLRVHPVWWCCFT